MVGELARTFDWRGSVAGSFWGSCGSPAPVARHPDAPRRECSNAYSNGVVVSLDRAGQPVLLPKEFRCRHLLTVGATGVGKSKAIEAMIRQDLGAWPATRCGLALFDPHGPLVDNILPPGRHILDFSVKKSQDHERESDLSFAVFVSEVPPPSKLDAFRKAVEAHGRDFIERVQILSKVKNDARSTLADTGHDPDELEVELSKLDQDLQNIDPGQRE